jgi:hypothetical protein
LAAHRVIIIEVIRFHWLGFVLCCGGFLPALWAAFYYGWNRFSGHARRILWCWLLPAAPLMIVWDGFVSCLRCWTAAEWRAALQAAGMLDIKRVEIETRLFDQMVRW